MTQDQLMRRVVRPAVAVLCVVPLGVLVWRAFAGGLGANPIEAGIRFLGDWALRFVVLGLAITPARQLTGLNSLIRLRRLIGLVAFSYATLHLLGYVVVDQFFAWDDIWKDIVKRPYITIGVACFLMLIPLAVTSTDAWVRRLGGKRWQKLHRLVYPVALLAVVHYYLLVKADVRQPVLYGALVVALLAYRAVRSARKRRALAAPARGPAAARSPAPRAG